jgi:methanogenic corrinoid protein MtbC1
VGEAPRRSGYSIAAVSKLTGISCHAIRVWERRYGFPVPGRTESGHRRYGAEQVELVRAVAEAVRGGRAIGDVMDDLRAGRLAAAGPAAEEPPAPSAALLDRLAEGRMAEAEAAYRALAEGLGPAERIRRLVEPGLVETGERWFRGEIDVAQERCASGFLRRKASELYDAAQAANPAPRRLALVGTPQGDRHEGGVLIVCALLELAGWRAIYLGTDLPVPEYQKALDRWRPDALAVSFVLSRNINKRFEELAGLRGAPVFVGGRSILNYRSLARRVGLSAVPGPGPRAVADLIARVESGAAGEGEGDAEA